MKRALFYCIILLLMLLMVQGCAPTKKPTIDEIYAHTPSTQLDQQFQFLTTQVCKNQACLGYQDTYGWERIDFYADSKSSPVNKIEYTLSSLISDSYIPRQRIVQLIIAVNSAKGSTKDLLYEVREIDLWLESMSVGRRVFGDVEVELQRNADSMIVTITP
jgi:hypothetical protein